MIPTTVPVDYTYYGGICLKMSTKRHEFADDRPLIYKLFKNVKLFGRIKIPINQKWYCYLSLWLSRPKPLFE